MGLSAVGGFTNRLTSAAAWVGNKVTRTYIPTGIAKVTIAGIQQVTGHATLGLAGYAIAPLVSPVMTPLAAYAVTCGIKGAIEGASYAAGAVYSRVMQNNEEDKEEVPAPSAKRNSSLKPTAPKADAKAAAAVEADDLDKAMNEIESKIPKKGESKIAAYAARVVETYGPLIVVDALTNSMGPVGHVFAPVVAPFISNTIAKAIVPEVTEAVKQATEVKEAASASASASASTAAPKAPVLRKNF